MKKRLIIYNLVIYAITFIIIGVLSLSTVYRILRNNLLNVSNQAMTLYTEQLLSSFDFCPSYIAQVSINDTVQDTLRTLSASLPEDIRPDMSQSIDSSLEQNPTLHNFLYHNQVSLNSIPHMLEITVRSSDGYYTPVYSSYRTGESDTAIKSPDDPWIQTLEELNGKTYWDYYSTSSNTYLRVSKVILDNQDFDKILGTVSFDLCYEPVVTSVLSKLNQKYDINATLFELENRTPVGFRTIILPDEIHDAESDSPYILPDNSGCLIVKSLGSTPFGIAGIASLESLSQTFRQNIQIFMAVFSFSTIISILLSYVLSSHFVKPILHLSKTMKNTVNGNFDITVTTNEKTEIKDLYDSYNYMNHMMKQMINDNYIALINQQQSELNALQSQINTHFLYNTLDSINWMAKDYQADNISNLVINLSTLLRISLNSGQPEISIAKELEHVKSYINIQLIRFQDLFQYEIHFDPIIEHDTIIKMLLQPLVENAILHAFTLNEDKEDNFLSINIYPTSEYLVLDVENTAEPEALDTILQLLSEEPAPYLSRHYGIKSIKKRLDIAYNQEAEFNYSMDTFGLLKATIRIPRKYTTTLS